MQNIKALQNEQGSSAVPFSMNKGQQNYQNEGTGMSTKGNNFKDYKSMFEEEYPQRKQLGQVNQRNYFQDSLDEPKFAQQQRNQQYEDPSYNMPRKTSNRELDSLNMLQANQFNKYSNQNQEISRQNSRQQQKRDILATNAERMLHQDFSSNFNRQEQGSNYNRILSANKFMDHPQNNNYDNHGIFGQGKTYQDNLNPLNNFKANMQSQKPPLYNQERFDNFQNRNQLNQSPFTLQQNNLDSVKSQNSQNQANFFKSTDNNQGLKQSESSPSNNISKQRKYQDLYGSSAHNYDSINRNNSKSESLQNQQNISPPVPRNRSGTNPAIDNMPKQHYEQRNQGLMDILFLKKRYAEHKIISDTSGVPGTGLYKQSLVNRLQSTKKIEDRKAKLKQLYIKDKVQI